MRVRKDKYLNGKALFGPKKNTFLGRGLEAAAFVVAK